MKYSTIPVILLLIVSTVVLAQDRKDYPFFAFNSGVIDPDLDSPAKQALLLKNAGYDGMELMGTKDLATTLAALDEHGLELYTIYLNINLDDPHHPYDPQLRDVFRMIRGRKTMPWFNITSKQYKPSSAENDTIAVRILREVADMANEFGVKVMIYPHVRFWVENIDDAVRVASKVNRRNVGITFNLCHFLADQGTNAADAFIPSVEAAMPYLFAISLNGADVPTAEILKQKNIWKYLIQPLDEGGYDTFDFFNAFVERGFKGPVGLQCYNVQGDRATILGKSMEAWNKIWRRMPEK